MKKYVVSIYFLLGSAASFPIFAQPTFLGPSYYYIQADSPFLGQSDSPFTESDLGVNFFIEDFEDGDLAPGITATVTPEGVWHAVCTTGQVVNGLSCGQADSVDGDDGEIDGDGSTGFSYHVSSSSDAFIIFTFDSNTLGFVPTHVGVVWTDGEPQPITFEPFDNNGSSLGILSTNVPERGGTAEDRFFGIISDEGISAIKIASALGYGIEADHLQWGRLPLIEVEIDIKPNNDNNNVNLSSAGIIPVAILSKPDFNAPLNVDPNTITLAGARVKIVGKSDKTLCHESDVNNDSLIDLICKVYTADFIVEVAESIAVLEAETYDNIPIRGEDIIRIVP